MSVPTYQHDKFAMMPQEIEARITPRTKAVMPKPMPMPISPPELWALRRAHDGREHAADADDAARKDPA